MKMRFSSCLAGCLMFGTFVHGLNAQAPRNVSVTFNGEADAAEPLATDIWHTITASYRYDGNLGLLTNTYLVIARGGDLLSGFDVGYHVPTNQLAIVKHGYWNATEATGLPGEAGKIIENDQGFLDCEHTRIEMTANDISVAYRRWTRPRWRDWRPAWFRASTCRCSNCETRTS